MKYIHPTKNPVIIIDGNLYLYRFYYAFKQFRCILGKPSGAIYGMLRMLYNILIKYKHSKKLIIVFDSSKKTFRNKLFKEYKINRPKMPNSLYIQIKPLFQILTKIGIKKIKISGIEADDIIGSLAHKLERYGKKVLIFSHDKDMTQLVTRNIHILHKINNVLITPDTIKEKYGIQPKEFIDLLALMGDSSDNIPGVPKIGIKTALFLLKKFSNINNIYNNIKKIQFLPLRNAKNIAIQLKNYKADAYLSYKLAQIQLNIAINVQAEDMNIKNNCLKKLPSLFKDYRYHE